MNAARRKQIEQVHDKLIALQSDLEILRDEEEEALANLPENMQTGDRGLAMDEARQQLDDAIDELNTVMESLDSARGNG